MQFFYGNEPDMFTFFKIPKLLFSEPYKGISTDAKLLFGLMLDRMSLSAKGEHWIDHDGRVFIYFPIQDVMELLNIADNRATKLYKELESVELIERKRQGLGKPTKIYVCKFFKESQKSRIKNRENHESRIVAETNQESLKSRLLPIIEIESNKTESNETENIIPPNPPKGGTGESSPISSENPYSNSGGANKAESGKGRRGSRDAVPMEALSPEDESTLLSISPRLCEVVRSWITCKAEANHALTPTSKRALIEQLKRNVRQYGADIVADTIEESLANGYAGIAWSRAAQMKKAKDEQDKQLPSYGFKIIGDSDSGDYYQYYQDVQSRNAAAAEYARKVNEAWGITSDW